MSSKLRAVLPKFSLFHSAVLQAPDLPLSLWVGPLGKIPVGCHLSVLFPPKELGWVPWALGYMALLFGSLFLPSVNEGCVRSTWVSTLGVSVAGAQRTAAWDAPPRLYLAVALSSVIQGCCCQGGAESLPVERRKETCSSFRLHA